MDAPEYYTDSPPPYSSRDPHPTAGSTTITSANSSRLAANRPTSYHIHRGSSGSYKVFKDDITQKFSVDVHKFRQPNLIVRRETAQLIRPELAHVKFAEMGDHCDIGMFRQSGVKGSIVWMRMTGDLRMSVVVPLLDAQGAVIPNTSVRRPFVWKGTSILTLEDEESGMVAAVVHEMAHLPSKIAAVEILVPFGEPFFILVLTAYLALHEKLRINTKVPSGYRSRGHAARAHAGHFAGTAGFAGGGFAGGGAGL
ncbi:hypothetical protein N7474_005573 [Penicillium riverlandense]|uniref:uncharacterized protein n=1 Tax=Penicillium riverlandense TaxID=1903569 RepID=UPI002548DCE2|nr:uncharacterized protein N7474_005573 [Penicillium riverlandense]KAJ5819982.1 hypothetical protein N7474_005573 [Penicillium riverlandense]